MVNFHNRVSVKARESWEKLKTLHGFLKKATVVTDAPLSKDEAQYESRIEDTVEALNGSAAAYGNLEEFHTPEVSQPLEYQPIGRTLTPRINSLFCRPCERGPISATILKSDESFVKYGTLWISSRRILPQEARCRSSGTTATSS